MSDINTKYCSSAELTAFPDHLFKVFSHAPVDAVADKDLMIQWDVIKTLNNNYDIASSSI